MTDDKTLREIVRHEKRLQKLGLANGLMLAKSARECHAELLACREKVAANAKAHTAAKARLAKLEAAAAKARESRGKGHDAELLRWRRVVKSGERLICREHVMRLRLEDKVRRLAALPVGNGGAS